MSFPVTPTDTRITSQQPVGKSSSSSNSPANELPAQTSDPSMTASVNKTSLVAVHPTFAQQAASYRSLMQWSGTILGSMGLFGLTMHPNPESETQTSQYSKIASGLVGLALVASSLKLTTAEEDWGVKTKQVVQTLSSQNLNEPDLKQAMKQHVMDTVGCDGAFKGSLQQGVDLLKKEVNKQLKENVGDPGARENLTQMQTILEDPTLFSSQEAKNGRLFEETPTTGDRVRALRAEEVKTITCSQVSPEDIQQVRKERLWRLNHLQEVYGRVIQDPNQAVSTKFFPRTTALYVGGTGSGKVAFEVEIANFVGKHGITVISDSKNADFKACENSIHLDVKGKSQFPQDYLDAAPGDIRTPVFKAETTPLDIQKVIKSDRETRFPMYASKELEGSVLASSTIGRAYDDDLGKQSLNLASALKVPGCMNLTYSEGGNVLHGVRGGKPYIIVGKDTLAASKALMEKDLKRALTQDEVNMAFGIDYGVEKDNVFFVEQPGGFHLDMNMAIVGENTIAVNDAGMALDNIQPHFATLTKIPTETTKGQQMIQESSDHAARHAAQKKAFEDKAVKDLRDQGFTVERIGGKLDLVDHFKSTNPQGNFFNFVTATAPDGERLVIALGVPTEKPIGDRFKEQFLAMMAPCGVKPENVLFLNFEDTKASLKTNGGASCRTKTIGENGELAS